MKDMTALIEKIDLVLANEVTLNSASQLVDELETNREKLIFKAYLGKANKLTPEIDELFKKAEGDE